MHHNQHLKKCTAAIDPLLLAYFLCACENDDNSGRPLLNCELGSYA